MEAAAKGWGGKTGVVQESPATLVAGTAGLPTGIVFTRAARCSIRSVAEPSYWNLDVAEAVVARTPLSDESRGFHQFHRLDVYASDHIPLPRWAWPLVRLRVPKPMVSPQSPPGP